MKTTVTKAINQYFTDYRTFPLLATVCSLRLRGTGPLERDRLLKALLCNDTLIFLHYFCNIL